jgi:hypothetical protein
MSQYSSVEVVYGEAFVKSVLAAYKTIPGGPLVSAGKLRLTSNPSFTPTPQSDLLVLEAEESDFSGYPAGGIAVVLTAPVNLSTVAAAVLFTGLFEAAAATPFVGGTVYGYWIDDGTNMICAERFDGGVGAPFAAPGDFLNLTVILPFMLQQPAT